MPRQPSITAQHGHFADIAGKGGALSICQAHVQRRRLAQKRLLAVSANMPALELVDVVPLRFKVGAPDDVEKFVLSALPGVRLQYAPQLPAAVPVRPDTCYFMLDAKGQMYERMLQAQSISIYVPSGMQELKVELVAVTG